MTDSFKITSLRDNNIFKLLKIASKSTIPHLIISLNYERNSTYLSAAKKEMQKIGIIKVDVLEIKRSYHIHIFSYVRCNFIKISFAIFKDLDSKAKYFVTTHSQCKKIIFDELKNGTSGYDIMKEAVEALKRGTAEVIGKKICFVWHRKEFLDCMKRFKIEEEVYFRLALECKPISYFPLFSGLKYLTLAYFSGIKKCFRIFETAAIFILNTPQELICSDEERFLLQPYIRFKSSLPHFTKNLKSQQLRRTFISLFYRNRSIIRVSQEFDKQYASYYQYQDLFKESCIDFENEEWIFA